MGANAATQALRLIYNVERVLAIELYNASQALFFREPLRTSDFLSSFLESYRKEVSMVHEDRFMHEDIDCTIKFIKGLSVDNEVIFN